MVILATGYVYDFPFLKQEELGIEGFGSRHLAPLYRHLIHASTPTIGFVGIPLSIPAPIPFFAMQLPWRALGSV